MSKHKLISIILIILLIFPSVAIAAGKPAASISSDTDEYILVRKDVFNALVTNDKLVNLYKSENDRYKNVISNLEDAYNSKDINTNKQIETLKQIISNDNEIIVTKDNNIKNYEIDYCFSLYQLKKIEEMCKRNGYSFGYYFVYNDRKSI